MCLGVAAVQPVLMVSWPRCPAPCRSLAEPHVSSLTCEPGDGGGHLLPRLLTGSSLLLDTWTHPVTPLSDFYPHNAMLAWCTLWSCVCLSVCPSQLVLYQNSRADRACFCLRLSYTVLEGNFTIKGTSLWNFAPNSGLREMEQLHYCSDISN